MMKDVPYSMLVVAGCWYEHEYCVCSYTCARYSVNPRPLHQEAGLKIMKYEYGIIYRRQTNSSSRMSNWVIERVFISL